MLWDATRRWHLPDFVNGRVAGWQNGYTGTQVNHGKQVEGRKMVGDLVFYGDQGGGVPRHARVLVEHGVEVLEVLANLGEGDLREELQKEVLELLSLGVGAFGPAVGDQELSLFFGGEGLERGQIFPVAHGVDDRLQGLGHVILGGGERGD